MHGNGLRTGKLIQVIEHSVKNGRYLSKKMMERMGDNVSHFASTEQVRHEQHSDRESQAVSLLASGRTVGQIVIDINLGVTMVSTYRTWLLTKQGM